VLGLRIRLLVWVTASALVCGLAGFPATPALAAPPDPPPPGSATIASADDASLSALTVTGNWLTPLAPAFDPATHVYEVVGNDNAVATVTPTVGTGGATAVVTSAGNTYALSSGSASVPLTRNRNDIIVTVTSPDSSTTETYRVTVWRLGAPTSQIVQVADAHSTVYGGTRMTVTLADGALPDGCSRSYTVGGLNAGMGSMGPFSLGAQRTFDPASGLTKDVVTIPAAAGNRPGTVDLVLTNVCYGYGISGYQAVTTSHDAVTYTSGYPIDRADVPAAVTTGSKIVLYGADVAGSATYSYWINDAHGTSRRLYNLPWTGNGNVTLLVFYGSGDAWYQGSGPRTLHAGTCPSYVNTDFSSCTTTYSKTVNWVAPVPTDLSYTPTSGPMAGGTTIRLRGRFLTSGTGAVVVKVGGQTATYSIASAAAYNLFDLDKYFTGQDVLQVTTPPATSAGPVPITVTTNYGTAKAPALFTYAGRPVITSVTPASVANTGGSVITVQGTDFGSAGRPTVIIGGAKSPSVTRISATRLTAVVPSSSGTGPVDVTVSSPQGGGVSLAATLNLVAPTTVPAITRFSATSGHTGDEITVTGTGFGPTGTAGVSVDGMWARVTASSATTLTFEVPTTDTPGAKDVVVAATTGAVTSTGTFTVLPDSGITTVTPATVPSYATGSAATVTLQGNGFGARGTVKVGTAAAVAYTATAGGTSIADVAVPTSASGSVPIVVTPIGSATPLRSSVLVTAPAITYVGSDPESDNYHDVTPSFFGGAGGVVLDVPTAGGSAMRVEGTGFGTDGTLSLDGDPVVTDTWTDTAITFTAPAHTPGTVSLTVKPTGASLSAARIAAANYVDAAVGQPSIGRIASVVDNSRTDRNEFDPVNDVSDAFTLTGTGLAGSDSAATRVVISAGDQSFTVVPTEVSDTSLVFAAPRSFTAGGWKTVQVTTNVGNDSLSYGMNYLAAGVEITVSPDTGLCLRTDTTGTGSVPYSPASVTVSNSGALFGSSGTVTVDGVAVTTTSYTDGQVEFSMADLATDLTDPWGGKTVVITPDDTAKAAQHVGFTCGVTPSVTTTINGLTDDQTVAAGTTWTPGYTTTGFIGADPFTTTAPDGYEYVTATDYDATGFDQNVRAGVPVGAGDYYVRVALSDATYASEQYLGFTPTPVRLTITGTPITITPTAVHGASFTYLGQLGDGTGDSSRDFSYTPSSTTDPITGVVWEYRDTVCANQSPTAGWTEGLPRDVALSATACGGDGTTRSGWEVRVKSFEMKTSGTDRSIYYQATLPSVQVTVNPRNLTVNTVRADRVYDGTTAAALGDLTFTGAVDGDSIALANGGSGGTFADTAPGVNKPVTLAADLALTGAAATDYTLTNPRPAIVGTITKASAVLSLAASPRSVLLSLQTPVTVTATVNDTRTGQAVASAANAAPVVLTSNTPTICTVSGTTVTAVAAGTCEIAGTQASSINYQAARAASDGDSTTETVEITVLAAAQALSVVADDLTVAVGDPVDPTVQISGLFDGDSIGDVEFDYYSGTTQLNAAPTTVGTYRVVPRGGTLQAANTAAYSNPTAFTYVAGSLLITALPPVITMVAPASGPIVGGTSVTVTGTRLGAVGSVRIGGATLRRGSFIVNQAGTELTFTVPKVADAGSVDLVLVAGTASATDVYTYTEPPAAPTAPGVPTRVTLVAGNGRVTVIFTPPGNTGGRPITAYQVSLDNGRTWRTVSVAGQGSSSSTAGGGATINTPGGGGRTSSITITGLSNGVTYPVQVRAVNRVGAGPASTARLVMPNAPVLPPVVHPPAEIPVPANPDSYHGSPKYTKARNTSAAGISAHGIPDLGARQLIRGEAATLSRNGLFEFDSAVLTAAGRAEVRALAGHLRAARSVTCEGYTDYAGQKAHEMTLSLQRAAAVCKALIQYGARVRTVNRGYGGARPVVVGGTAASREANRRVVVVVTG
jgi:outer membrane protein OmpA-like peptidoglycan-associated protein